MISAFFANGLNLVALVIVVLSSAAFLFAKRSHARVEEARLEADRALEAAKNAADAAAKQAKEAFNNEVAFQERQGRSIAATLFGPEYQFEKSLGAALEAESAKLYHAYLTEAAKDTDLSRLRDDLVQMNAAGIFASSLLKAAGLRAALSNISKLPSTVFEDERSEKQTQELARLLSRLEAQR